MRVPLGFDLGYDTLLHSTGEHEAIVIVSVLADEVDTAGSSIYSAGGSVEMFGEPAANVVDCEFHDEDVFERVRVNATNVRSLRVAVPRTKRCKDFFLFDYGSFFFLLLRKAATHESIVENVGSAEDYHPEAGDVVARDVGYKTLDEHHHSATEDHGHEDTAGDGRVFAETFHCHVEDRTPHHGSAKTYEQEGEDTYGNGLPNERKCVPVNAGGNSPFLR